MTIDAAIDALQSLLGDRITRSKSDRDLHGQSESHFPLTPPDAVAYPETTEEVSALVKICAAHGCPVIGWGAGTSLEGHGLAIRGGISVDFSRMNRVLEVSPEDMDARVQPGVTREGLNAELRATGLFFPVDPGANASLGGMAATRASGTTAVRYGTMRDNVLGLEVVLAVCAFETMDGAVAAVVETIQTGVPMARIEFVDAATALAVNGYSGASFPALPHLLVEFHGTEAGVAEQAETFGTIATDHGGRGFDWARKAEDRNRLWKMRHEAYLAILASRPGARAIVTDVCVPISRLAEAVAETQADIEASPIPGPILGHVGDGNFHAILLMDTANSQEVEAAEALSARMAERALRLGGTVTGEHGVGMGKLGYMEAEHGGGWDVMGAIKAALDPEGIMNPGKIVRGN